MPRKINSEIGRTSIDEPIKMKLWAISGGRCELCNQILYSDLTFGRDGNFGELAHIHAVSPSGPRHKYGMTQEEKNNIENLMLLCAEHHHMIDTNPEEYGDGLLLECKRRHEARIRQATEISPSQTCRMVAYFSNIDQSTAVYSERLFKQALFSSGLLPMQHPPINLHEGAFVRYNPSKEAIAAKATDLELQFKSSFQELVKTEDAVAIFALAPQPLLFKLGTLLNDQYNVRVFQCHRTGHKWAWKTALEDSAPEYRVSYTRENNSTKVALVIDLSAEILDDRVTSVLGEDCSILHLTINSPNMNFVTHPSIQDAFADAFRAAMEQLKNMRPAPVEIHLFMAMPNSLVIRAGMSYMPKADLPIILYEQASATDGFFETIKIGG